VKLETDLAEPRAHEPAPEPARTHRDVLAEIGALADAVTAEGGWVAGTVANRLRHQLERDDPQLLNAFLRLMADDTLRSFISARERSRRAVERARAGSRRFAQAAADAEDARDYGLMSGAFAVSYVVDSSNMRRRVADMTGADHVYVADRYAHSANEARMLSAFHRAVAERVGDRKTSDVFSETEYASMLSSVIRSSTT
jgi:hypothetical protein